MIISAASGEELGSNEFTAGRVLSLNCIVQGNSSEDLTYTWSVKGNPDTPGCNVCGIDTSSTTSTLTVGRPLTSFFAGIYTCTVSESGRSDSDNSDDFNVTVVGNVVCKLPTVIIILFIILHHTIIIQVLAYMPLNQRMGVIP